MCGLIFCEEDPDYEYQETCCSKAVNYLCAAFWWPLSLMTLFCGENPFKFCDCCGHCLRKKTRRRYMAVPTQPPYAAPSGMQPPGPYAAVNGMQPPGPYAAVNGMQPPGPYAAVNAPRADAGYTVNYYGAPVSYPAPPIVAPLAPKPYWRPSGCAEWSYVVFAVIMYAGLGLSLVTRIKWCRE